MTENKKNGEAQVTTHSTTVSPAATTSNETKEHKKTCPALYPSKPYTSNK